MKEFEAVVLAAGKGSRLNELTSASAIPKPLLPVANMPMIWYPVNMLEKAGFEEIIIIVLEEHKDDIAKSLYELCDVKMDLHFVVVPDEDLGSADSLRYIADRIHRDALIVSCDLITNVPFHLFVDFHRRNDATVTMLMAERTEQVDAPVPGAKSNKIIDKDYFGLDKKEERVLLLHPAADLEDKITFSRSMIRRYPVVELKMEMLDSHLYLVKKQVFTILKEQSSMRSFKEEFIPYLVKRQFKKPKKPKEDSFTEKDGGSSSPVDFNKLAKSMSTHSTDTDLDEIKCYAYNAGNGFCFRTNSLFNYCEANKQIPRELTNIAPGKPLPMIHGTAVISERTQTGVDSMVGESTTIGDRSVIKKSVIGRHCIIKEKVKITNSVIMDHVTIEEGAVITGSVVSCNVTLGEKCDLKDSIVGISQSIMSLGKYKQEVIAVATGMLEI